MRAILINAKTRTISEIHLNENDVLLSMQTAVGGYIERAHTIDNRNEIYVDEEGLLKNSQDFFIYNGAHQPFAGNGLIVGHDREGDTTPTTVSVSDVYSKVKFASLAEIRKGLAA